MTYADRGLREMIQGLAEAKTLVTRKRHNIQMQMGTLEAELSALGKIESAVESSIEVLREAQAAREAETKEQP